MKSLMTAAIGLSMLTFGACAQETKAVRYDEAAASQPPQTEVEIGPRVAEACRLDTNKAYFGYNSAALDTNSQIFADQLAQCMKDGPLKGKKILVVGYTDPTGSENYNQELGMDRSESVANRLVACGVASDRIFVKSGGERSDDPQFYSRRVEIRVADED
ncbi:MAG: OmpA family protein [Deltaproteobacteria bacterium]|nr:OmpA family protein [Deltaproteobacteria bacterium]